MSVNRYQLCFAVFCLLILGCGDDGGDSGDMNAAAGGAGGADSMSADGSCFTPADCAADQYCRATDPAVSPEGVCQPQEAAGGPCSAGLDCQTGLFCKSNRGESLGLCTAFPEACADAATCMCAIETCSSLAGSSCSVSSPDDPANTMQVVCAP